MSPILTALGEPMCWTRLSQTPWWRRPKPSARPELRLEHPSGFRIKVQFFQGDDDQSWTIGDISDHGTNRMLGLFNKSALTTTLKDFHQDLDRAYGPNARARLDRLLQSLRIWCLQHDVQDDAQLVRSRLYGAHIIMDRRALNVPPELHDAAVACAHVLSPAPDGSYLHLASHLPINIRASRHEVLRLRAQARQNEIA